MTETDTHVPSWEQHRPIAPDRSEKSPKKLRELTRLFENKNIKASEVISILAPYGFILDNKGTKHRRLIHRDEMPRNEQDPSRSYFFSLPIHGGSDTLSTGVLRELRVFVYFRLSEEIRQALGFTPLEYFKTA